MKTLGIKIVTLILAMFIGRVSIAADYYFSSSTGDDSRTAVQAQNPNTPWQSIEKLNMIFNTLKPGDRVYLKRGDTFFGTIHMNASGSPSAPIKIDAYGSGNSPLVTSMQKITNWRSIGNGIFESTSSINTQRAKIVLLDGNSQHMGRFPNSNEYDFGYLTIESVAGSSSIRSGQLAGTANFNGGEVVIRKNQWIIDTHQISSHSGHTINYQGNATYSASTNYGFFVQNHIQTLDQVGEWYFNSKSKKLNVFFGNNNPSPRTIEVSTLDNLLTKGYGVSYVTVENLHFRGANGDIIHLTGGRDITLQKLTIEFAGENAVLAKSVVNIKLMDSKIRHSNNNGVFFRYGNTNALVKGNIVENSGILPGGVSNGDVAGIGIVAMDHNSTIENNEVYNTGYSGIYFAGNNSIVKNNFVDNFCLIKGDGGGIYTYVGPNNGNFHNLRIIQNIVLNGKGHVGGVPKISSNPRGMAEGIFLDDNSNGVEITGNTVAHTENSGIKMSNVRNIIVRNNLIFDTDHNITLANSEHGADVRNVSIKGNLFFGKNNLQNSYTIHSNKNDIPSMGTFDENFFFRPFGDQISIFTRTFQNGNTKEQRLDVKSFSQQFGKDVNSKQSIVDIPKFVVKKALSDNLFNNKGFDANLSKIDFYRGQATIVPNKINGRTLQVIAGNDSFFFYQIGAVKKNKKYLIRFEAQSSNPAKLSLNFRHSGSPWQPVSSINTLSTDQSPKVLETIIEPVSDITSAGLIFSFNNPNVTYWIDNFEILEVEALMPDVNEKILFEYNRTNNPKKIVLQGKYVDARLKTFEGDVTIAPYSGIALLQTQAGNPPAVEIPVVLPEISLRIDEKREFHTTDTLPLSIHLLNTSPVALKKVTFYKGLEEIGTSTTTPFSFKWKNLPAGDHYLWAAAECAAGNNYRSQEIDIKVVKAVINTPAPKPETSPSVPSLTLPNNGIYIKTGSTRNCEYLGVTFLSEFQGQPYNGGNIESYLGASDEPIFQSQRFAKDLKYEIPVKNGSYQVLTFHNEVYFGKRVTTTGAGRRVYNIIIEGKLVKENFDLFVENNNSPMVLRHENVNVLDGKLSVHLQGLVADAAVSAIAIVPIGTVPPPAIVQPPVVNNPPNAIHINTGSTRPGTYKGVEYQSEFLTNVFSAGNIESYEPASTHSMMQSQRFAQNLSYTIPVENGEYQIITHHNEVFFGKRVATTGAGRRVYSISVQGTKTVDRFDLFIENNNLEMSIDHGIYKVVDGKVQISLSAISGDAAISGISIIPTSVTNPPQDDQIMAYPANGLYINAGSTREGTLRGVVFESEFAAGYFSSGNIESYPLASSESLFQSQRFAKNLNYSIPVPNGIYKVITFHNEVYFGKRVATTGPNRRVYDLIIEGNIVRKSFDLFVENENKEIELVFDNIIVKDGILNINLTASIGDAAISGIAVIPASDKITLAKAANRQITEIPLYQNEITDNSKANQIMYPNPAREKVNIRMASEISNAHLQIHDLAGRLVTSFPSNSLVQSERGIELPLLGIKPGTYLVTITDQTGIVFKERLFVN